MLCFAVYALPKLRTILLRLHVNDSRLCALVFILLFTADFVVYLYIVQSM